MTRFPCRITSFQAPCSLISYEPLPQYDRLTVEYSVDSLRLQFVSQIACKQGNPQMITGQLPYACTCLLPGLPCTFFFPEFVETTSFSPSLSLFHDSLLGGRFVHLSCLYTSNCDFAFRGQERRPVLSVFTLEISRLVFVGNRCQSMAKWAEADL